MSGRIDSTITALILHDEGYELVGITMQTWDFFPAESGKPTRRATKKQCIIWFLPGLKFVIKTECPDALSSMGHFFTERNNGEDR